MNVLQKEKEKGTGNDTIHYYDPFNTFSLNLSHTSFNTVNTWLTSLAASFYKRHKKLVPRYDKWLIYDGNCA